jgi:hypothetical protein
MVLGVLALLGGQVRVEQQAVMPMTPFIGVRISWLMLARNSLLARLASLGLHLGVDQRLLDRLAAGDVGEAADHPQRRPGLAALDHVAAIEHPDHAAVLAAHLVFVVIRPLAAQAAADRVHDGVALLVHQHSREVVHGAGHVSRARSPAGRTSARCGAARCW